MNATTKRTELERHRLNAGLTQGQLADAAGLDPSTISLIEAGKRGGHPATLHRLAEVLECGVVDLVDRVTS